MESQSEVQSAHNSSETTNVTVNSWDDLTDGQQLCIDWAIAQDWDRIKGYANEHGPEVLFGVYTERNVIASVLTAASYYQNVEIVKLTLEAGFDNKEAMCMAAHISTKSSDNSTILRLLLEHGLDPNTIRVQSSHNSSETTNVPVNSLDDLTEGQRLCLQWALEQDWDRIKGYAKEHGPEGLLGVFTKHVDEKVNIFSVLTAASSYKNPEMVKLTLEAGFNNKEAMCIAADGSIRNSDNSTILRLLLEHGLDKRIII
jgi:hypothetical protein